MNRKGLFYLTVFLVLAFQLNAAPKIYIKINTNECLKCYVAQMYTDKLLDYTDVSLVFPGNYNRSLRYLKMQFPVTAENYNIINSDSLYENLVSVGRSQLYVIENKQILYSCPMHELSRQFNLVVSKIEGTEIEYQTVSIPDSVQIKPMLFSAIEDKFLLFDPTLQELLIYNGESFLLLDPYSIDILTLYPFFDKDNNFTQTYNDNYEKLQGGGKANATFSFAYMGIQSVSILVKIPYAFNDENGNFVIASRQFIYQVELDDYSTHWYIIDDNSFPQDWYLSFPKAIVEYFDEQMIVSMKDFAREESSNLQYLATMKFNQDTIVFEKFLDYQIPSLHKEMGLFYDQLYPTGKYGFIFHQYDDVVIDIYNDSSFCLPIKNSKLEMNYEKLSFEHDFNFTDIMCKNDECRFTYKKSTSEANFIGTFIKNDVGSYSSNKIVGTEGFGTIVVFADYNQIVCYDRATNTVKYKLIP